MALLERANLTVSTVDARTLLAMKCAAARTSTDATDIRFLADLLDLATAAEVLDVVTAYFPDERHRCASGCSSRRCSMTVRDLLRFTEPGADFHLHLSAFVDELRRASPARRRAMIADGPDRSGATEGLVAAVVSALCRETRTEAAAWVAGVHSPEPFFAFLARA